MSDSKKIARNSLVLYIRLIVSSFIGLYSSRLVIQELGTTDFGLYVIVGGIVGLLNFLNSSMVSTSNRFLAIELGKKNNGDINRIFNTLLLIHIFLAILILTFGDMVGVWFINNHLNVPADKISDAKFVFHLSILTASITTIIIPFQGLLTSLEEFTVRASFEILQSILHLGFLILISFYSGNKLNAYAITVTLLSLIICSLYFIYTKLKYKIYTSWSFNNIKKEYREISIFFWWTLFYVIGSIGSKQGSALILNSFFGTSLNAALGIGSKVFEFIYSFVKNLNQAAVPQIMKNFSSGNQQKTINIIYNLSKFTFYIMFIPSLAIMLSMESLLNIWLKVIPNYSSQFAILMIIHGLVSCLESGFDATIESTGKIKKTKIIFNLIMICILPILYFGYTVGLPPYFLTIVFIAAEVLFLIFQMQILQHLTSFKISEYIKVTIYPIVLVTLTCIPQIYLRDLWGQTFIDTIIFSILSIILTSISILLLGLNKIEKSFILNKIHFKISKK